MRFLVVGATGATGRLLVRQLLDRGHRVAAVVRSPARLRAFVGDPEGLDVTEASVLDLSDEEIARHVEGCDGIASCLGHTMTVKGVLGPPRRLVKEAVRRLSESVRRARPAEPVRFVLMGSAGVRNRDRGEEVSFRERVVLGLLRTLVPPHADNEEAADFLRTQVGAETAHLGWAVVRPDALHDADAVTPYEIHPSPLRSAIFDAGRTSRINVAHFMAELLADDDAWSRWKGQMPVIYDTADAEAEDGGDGRPAA